MEPTSRDILIKRILKRAMEEGREGRVRMVHERLKAARDVPEDHRRVLLEITLFGKALPKSPFIQNMTIH
ncbi:MAG: hypothetical protein WC989_03275 [Micavibrio sp.]